MKGILPLRDVACLFLVLLVLYPPGKPVFAAPAGGPDVIQLTEAIQGGQVKAWAQPNANGMGFRKLMLVVHIKNLTGNALQIQIAPGTRYLSKDAKYASMLQANPASVDLDQPESMLEVSVFSLDPSGLFPPGMEDAYQYEVGPGDSPDPELLKLLDKVNSLQEINSFGAQLAVWSQVEHISLDQLLTQVNTGVKAEEVAEAQSLLGLPVTPPIQAGSSPQPSAQASEETPLVGQIPTKTTGSSLGGIFSAAVILVVLVVAVITIGDAQKRKALARANAQQENAASPPKKRPEEKPGRRITQDSASPGIIRLKACKGPHAGQVFSLQVPGLISRGELTWAVLPDPCVTIPHATVDMLEMPYQVKDLNGENGTWLGEQRLAKKFVDWPLGQALRLGSSLKLISIESGIMVEEGKQAGSIFHNAGNIVVVSGQNLPVLVTGDADRRISDVHALIRYGDKELVIRDLNSTNGTFVNQQRVDSETVIKDGDHVVVGDTEFEIQTGSQA